jgi:hypothetical protein
MDMAVRQLVEPWGGIGQWADAVADLHARIAHRFARSEVRERARRYLVGLLGRFSARTAGSWLRRLGRPGRGVCSAT